VENDPHLITAYLTFLAERTSDVDKVDSLTSEQLADMVLDMAQLIVERSTVMAAVLPVSTDTVTVFNIALNSLVNIFYTFLCRVSFYFSKCILLFFHFSFLGQETLPSKSSLVRKSRSDSCNLARWSGMHIAYFGGTCYDYTFDLWSSVYS